MRERVQRIADFIASELLLDPTFELSPDEDMLAAGLIDSMGIVRLVAFVSEEFATSIPEEHIVIENFGSVRAIDAYLRTRD
ncbi:MAG TPA: acyl carrier protein [Acidimicrobiia bacterium]|nr:acyl carrier protein [Acidimicrobiia bacterium]